MGGGRVGRAKARDGVVDFGLTGARDGEAGAAEFEACFGDGVAYSLGRSVVSASDDSEPGVRSDAFDRQSRVWPDRESEVMFSIDKAGYGQTGRCPALVFWLNTGRCETRLLNIRYEFDLPEVPPRMRTEALWSLEVYLLGRGEDVILA